MPTLGSGVSRWNNIDDSRWVIGRTNVNLNQQTFYQSSVDIHYISCPPPDDAPAKATVLLIHGFPKTSYHFRRVITPIANAGYHVIAPDYRGAGQFSKPDGGYSKKEMAKDLYNLVQRIAGGVKVHVVGHDIGSMVAHAYALQFPQDIKSVTIYESVLPGTPFYESIKNHPTVWHFSFHNVPDVPEALVAGREKIYLKYFYDRFAQNPGAISPHDLDVYTNAYSQPGALRAALNCYRAFEQDGIDNRSWLESSGKSNVPCLVLAGEGNEQGIADMCRHLYQSVLCQTVVGAGHYIAEEQPDAFVRALADWLELQALVVAPE